MMPTFRWTTAASVAALAAATLASAGCEERSALDAPAGAARELPARWLVPPDAALEPPIGLPLALAVDEPRDRLLVLDGQPPALLVYDLAGRYRTTLGRAGEGPGEYSFPIDLAVNADGVAAVLTMSGRLTFWSPADELLGVAAAGGAGIASAVLSARGDTFYAKLDGFPPDDFSAFRSATPDTVLPGARFTDDSVPGLETPGLPRRNHSYAAAAAPDGDILLAPPGPDYLILRFGAGGELRQTIRRPEVPPLRRSAAEIETMREQIRKRFAELGANVPQQLPVPELRSHIARLALAPDSTLWALTRRGADSLAVIDAFDRDGQYTATYQVALPASDIALGAQRIYLLATSDLDLPGIAVVTRPDRPTER